MSDLKEMPDNWWPDSMRIDKPDSVGYIVVTYIVDGQRGYMDCDHRVLGFTVDELRRSLWKGMQRSLAKMENGVSA